MSPASVATATYPYFTIEVVHEHEEGIFFSTETVPDPEWKFVDKKGHGHFWKKDKLPTLKKVATGKTWVGDEYDGHGETIYEMRCKLCDETIEPGTKQQQPKPPPPMIWYRLSIGEKKYELSEKQYAEAIEALGEYMDREFRRVY